MSLNNISLKSKLVFMLLTIAIGCILIVGYQGLSNGEKALKSRIYDQLTSERESKGHQVEVWYKDIKSQLAAISASHTTIYAMREFSSAFNRMAEDAKEPGDEINILKNYYETEFFPKLEENIEIKPDIKHYLPKQAVSQQLQLEYIAKNPNPVGKKSDLIKSKDINYYNSLHEHYHPPFKQIISSNGFYDLFLISIDTGDIVYSVEKEVDFATSLKNGPYRNSNLGQLFSKLTRSQNFGETISVDYDFYKPSYGQPGMFMGSTIFDLNHHPIGVLVLQVSSSRLDDVMTSRKSWEKHGLGKTGETFLVGEDQLMRSNARQLFNEGEGSVHCYTNDLYKKLIMDKKTAENICQFRTSILLQKVDGEYIRGALNGQSGTTVTTSYAGNEVLAAYKPLYLGSMKWAVVAQLDSSEANAPVREFQKELGISAVLIACAVTFIAMLAATIFINPLNKLMKGVRKLGSADNDLHIDLQRGDEYGELAKAMNQAGDIIRTKDNEIQDKNAENYRLLLNILPEKVAKRYIAGKKDFAEQIDSASVVYIAIRGFNECTHIDSPTQAIQIFNQLVSEMDMLASHHEVERIKTVGDNYLAACGVNVSRLDHARRTVIFARELLDMIPEFNHSHHTRLSLHIGVHCGSVLAGITGEGQFSYDLWGDAVNAAEHLRGEALPNTLLITEQTYSRLDHTEGFRAYSAVKVPNLGEMSVYIYAPESLQVVSESSPPRHEAGVAERPLINQQSA